METLQRNLKLTVEYDGTDFFGFQTQEPGVRTVQTDLKECIEKIFNHPVKINAAGRTDTGVHALGQVVSFKTTGRIPTKNIVIALNSNLPRDIAVVDAVEVDEDFHARFSAKSRTYAYTVWTKRARSAIFGRYCLQVRRPLDIMLMRKAAKSLVGSYDFASFAKTGGNPGPSTIRRIDRISIRAISDDRILFLITANAFLRSMVRNIVGMLLDIGYGDLQPEMAEEILNYHDRLKNPCAPAAPHGLCLLRVDY